MEYLESLSTEDRLRWYQYHHEKHLQLCRENFLVFGEYVGRDEETQQPIKQGRIHRTINGFIDENPKCVVFAHIGSGKTTSIAILRLAWEIGRNPAIRAGLLSSNEENAGNRLTRVTSYIEESAEYKEVFPHIRKSVRPGEKWIPNEQITVDRPLGPQHPTVRAIGLHNSILSWRCDLLIGDDILEFKHVVTKHERDKVMKWFEKTILGRTPLTRVWLLGVPHHKEDLLHRMIARGWPGIRIPVRDENGVINSPETWDHDKIEAKKRELGPAESARQLEPLTARDDTQAKFKEAWVQTGIDIGNGMRYPHTADDLTDDEYPEGSVIVTGIDLAVSKKDSGGETAMVTLLVKPDKTRRILDVWAGQISGPEIARKAIEIHYRYNSHLFVETNVAQMFLYQMVVEKDRDVPVTSFETRGSNKKHPTFGVESLADEMESSRWYIPNRDGQMPKDVFSLLQDMLSYDPNSHTGDRLMAAWIAREGARIIGREGRGTMKSHAYGSKDMNDADKAAKKGSTAVEFMLQLMKPPRSPEKVKADADRVLQLVHGKPGPIDLLVRCGDMDMLDKTLQQLPGGGLVAGAWDDLTIVRVLGHPHFVAWAMHRQGYAELVGVVDTEKGVA